ncbi:MAG: hypothetical protein U0984_18285 [Prosthecobacter sp.]|nr:hypothetical protein [Prosthecobacter sp.]
MTRTDLPLLHLAEPTARQIPQSRVHLFDALFLTAALVLVVGGALFLIDQASARSSGQEATFHRLCTEASLWLPAIMTGAAKYATLFLASIVNSALIVFLVTSLRSLDRKVGRMSNRRAFGFTPMRRVHNLRRAQAARARQTTVRARESQSFLLSPVFR